MSCNVGYLHWSFDANFTDLSTFWPGQAAGVSPMPQISSAQAQFGNGSLYSAVSDASWLSIPTVPFLTGAPDNSGVMVDWSTAIWLNTPNPSSYNSLLGSWDSGSYTFSWRESVADDTLCLYACYASQPNTSCTQCQPPLSANNEGIPSNQWVHLVLTYSAATQTLTHYINATASGSQSGIRSYLPSAPQDWRIGEIGDQGLGYSGYIDELWIINVTLTQPQISRLWSINCYP